MKKLKGNFIVVEGDISYVYLTKGYKTVIDTCDVDHVSKRVWHALVHKTKGKTYVYASTNVKRDDGTVFIYGLHRYIMDAPKGINVDHRDGGTLNNTRGNIRLATHSQNMKNRRLHTNNSSGYKGVCFRPESNKWAARITTDGKRQRLGSFNSPEEAAVAYNAAAQRLHGQFASLNSIAS
jgi:AP2 domain-containing protein/HNH endonuclease